MFTGIVERCCRVVSADLGSSALALRIDLEGVAEGVAVGDSIAVQGCCLTVTELKGRVAAFHLMGETLGLTVFPEVRPGDLLNVERSLRLSDRLGGHLVSGHVDGLGVVTAIVTKPGETDLELELPPPLQGLVVPKGSIAIDGVSLTVARIEGRRITVALIPHTLEVTSLGSLVPGKSVHLEMDMIGKWVRQFVAQSGT